MSNINSSAFVPSYFHGGILTVLVFYFFRDKKWLKDKDENLTGDDIQEGMYIVFNMTAPNVGYDAQVKSRVTKIETAIFTQALAENLRVWLETNEKEIKKSIKFNACSSYVYISM